MIQIRIRWLLTARTKPLPALDQPPCRSRDRRATSAAASHGPGKYLRCETMGGEPSYTMLRFGLVVSELSLPRQKSPAIMRPICGTRFEKSRTLDPQLLRSKPTQNVVKRLQIALCEVAPERHGWFERAFSTFAPAATYPRRRPRSFRLPAPCKSDRFASIYDATTAHAPRIARQLRDRQN
jgi:hypothetical protein